MLTRDEVDASDVRARIKRLREKIAAGDRITNLHQPFHPRLLCTGKTIKQTSGFKPIGLWWGCGSEWLDWIEHEQPNWLGAYTYRLRVDAARMLRLSTPGELDEFTRRYGAPPEKWREWDTAILWSRVAREWSGIEICPYVYERRHGLTWYYPWDVASGVTWDPCTILGAERIDP